MDQVRPRLTGLYPRNLARESIFSPTEKLPVPSVELHVTEYETGSVTNGVMRR